MKLEGLKINYLGDSITEGCGTTLRFDEIITAATGGVGRNYGIGGTRIAANLRPTEINPKFDRYFASRIEEMDPDADVVVVFGGTNDFGHGDAPFGEMSDRTYYTFYGALHLTLIELLKKYPLATIVYIMPLHRLNEADVRGDGVKPEGSYAPLKEYIRIIREVCEYYAIPVLDLWSGSGIQPAVDIMRETYMPDGLHPNENGHKVIASRLMGLLERL